MTTLFSMTRDINGYNGFGLIPTDVAYSVTLTANVDTTLTVPSYSAIGAGGYYNKPTSNGQPTLVAIILPTPGSEIWVAMNTAAAIPAGATFTLTSSAMNPSAYQVNGGDVIHCISSQSNVNVSVRFYWLN